MKIKSMHRQTLRSSWVPVVLLALLVAVGCGKTPEKSCARAAELSPHVVEADCVTRLTKQRDKSPKMFALVSKCIADAKNEASVEDCMGFDKGSTMGTQAVKADVPELKATDDVDKLSITNGDKGEVVLEKTGNEWRLTKPVSALANQENVKSLLDGMKELKIRDTSVNGPTDDIKKSYELDAAKGVHFQTWKGADKKLDLTFGKSGGGGDSVMVAGKTDIYLARGYEGWMYTRAANEWRDKEIFRFDDATATGVTVMNKNGTFVFTKGDKGWTGSVKDKPIAHLDADKMKAMLGTFKGLNADEFGDGKLPADTGMDAPDATITITLKDATHVLKVGKTKATTGQARYAMRDMEPTIYIVGPQVSGWATAEATKFQPTGDDGAKDAAPPGIPPGMGMPPGMN